MAETATPGGTIIRKDDGTWYYIRDDRLEEFRVTDDETLSAFSALENAEESDVEGFAMLPSGPASFERFRPMNIGFQHLALRANFGLGIGNC